MRYKTLTFISLCLSILLLTACVRTDTKKDENKEKEKSDTTNTVSIIPSFECFLLTHDPSCIQFDLIE